MSQIPSELVDPRFGGLSSAKQILLRRVLAERKRDSTRLRPCNVTGPTSLSDAQRRLWFIDRLDSGGATYNVSLTVRLSADIDLNYLHQALRLLVNRHPAFRTRFDETQEGPQQRVLSEFEWQPIVIDISNIPLKDRQLERKRIARDLANKPFNLLADSLFRWVIFSDGECGPDLMLVMHHIVCDGWSIQLILRELGQFYDALCRHQTVTCVPLAFSYSDYVAWQIGRDALATYANDIQFWRTFLGDDHTPLELPVDHPRSATAIHLSDSIENALSFRAVQQLQQLSLDTQSTPFMVLLAAWQLFLARYANQPRIRVATPVANRTPSETESIVGLFVNTIVLPIQINPQATFRELLTQVRQNTLDAFDHQQVPFGHLVDQLQPHRDPNYPPLAQTLFVMQNYVDPTVAATGLGITDVDLSTSPTGGYDLTLNVTPHADILRLLLVFRSDLFDRSTMEQMFEGFLTLLSEAIFAPDTQVSVLTVLSARQRQQLESWNSTASPFPANARVPDLIRAQAARTPNAIAISWDDTQISYASLIEQADQIAANLTQHHVTSGQRIGICLPRSPLAVACMLGISELGAAFLPLDPKLPDARLRYMIDDVDLAVIIADREHADRLALASERLLLVETIVDNIKSYTSHRNQRITSSSSVGLTPAAREPDDPAYLIYTSGSTGTPKAAELTHLGWVNHATDMARRMLLEPGDCRLQCLSISFDASLEEIFPALISGATLVMHPRPQELSSDEIRRVCQKYNIRQFNLLPALFEPLVNSLTDADRLWVQRLKAVVIGGDRLAPKVAQRWSEITAGKVRTLFVYGVTEATIANTVHELPTTVLSNRPIPIGKPISNQRIYVVDEQLQLTALGAVGELCVGGIGVGRGYVNREELTHRQFVDDPYGGVPGRKMYRTGDMVRWRMDGNLEFAGRRDQQLKIRGYRIEAGEIEAVLVCHPKIDDAKVIGRPDTLGRLQLVAYLIVREPAKPPAEELRAMVSGQLPAYMVPAAFVFLDRFPLASGGKVDCQALPAPDWRPQPAHNEISAPRNGIEQQLVDIWQRLLRVTPIGIHDNFFERGGDSILILQVVNEAAVVGMQITPKQLFLNQTIADLAPHVTAITTSSIDAAVDHTSPLTPIQAQFFHALWPNRNHFNQAVVLRVATEFSAIHLQRAWKTVFDHHRSLSSRFVTTNDHIEQYFPSASTGSSNWEHIEVACESESECLAAIDSTANRMQRSLDIANGPLVRVCLLELGKKFGARLIIVVHHLVVDGVSWRILVQDLQQCYDTLLRDEDNPLPAARETYAGWALALNTTATSYAVVRHRLAWLDWAPRFDLPRDQLYPTNLAGDTDIVHTTLDEESTTILVTSAQQTFRTKVNEFLLAALASAVAHWTGNRNQRFDIEQHGRDDSRSSGSWSRTVGWFTNSIPVSIMLPDQRDPLRIIAAVKDQLRSYLHRGNAFGVLRWLTQDAAICAQFPHGFGAEISFNYLGRLDEPIHAAPTFVWTAESTGPLSDPSNPRWHLLDVVAYVRDQRLQLSISYNRHVHRRATIVHLQDLWLQELRGMLQACQASPTGRWTASDFPLASISEHDLQSVLKVVRKLEQQELPS